MRLIKNAEETVWRAIEWSFVMGVLSWLFVRLWTDTLYDPRRPRVARNRWRRLWAWRPISGEGRARRASDDPPGTGDGV
jgi:predicted DCC family thiol-disulfide oxidoreductase YuxK